MVAGTDAKQRLIDADAVIKYLMTNMNWYDEDGYESDEDYKRECITELINGVPSAQPAAEPIRHVKNIGTEYNEVDQFVCSGCGIELQDWRRVERDDYDGEETYHEYRLRYCPNCGGRIVEE